MEAEHARKEDEQHGKRLPALSPRGTRGEEAGLAGSGVSGYHRAAGTAQGMHSCWIFSLEKPLEKMFENHYTITLPWFALRVQSDGECCSTGTIVGKWNRLRSGSPVSSAHLSLQRQILKIAQQPQNKQDFQRFLLVTTAKRLGLPKAGGRAAGCFPSFKITYSRYKSLDENWILTFFLKKKKSDQHNVWLVTDPAKIWHLQCHRRNFLLYRNKSILLSLNIHYTYMQTPNRYTRMPTFSHYYCGWTKIRLVAQALLCPSLIRCHSYSAFHKWEHCG